MGFSTAAVVLGIISLASAFNTLVPHGKELIYEYKALLRSGTNDPVSFASLFVLQGNLHLQSDENATYVKLTDLKQQLYNGKLDHVHEKKSLLLPLPSEVQDLEKVFKIIHDHDGKALGIVTEENEQHYTKNIKKSIANILQLDMLNIKMQEANPHAFITKEHSLYGQQEAHYLVLPQDDVVKVQKMLELTMNHYNNYIFSNTPISTLSDTAFENPISQDSQRKYLIHKSEMPWVQQIIATGGIYYHPFKGKSETQYLFVNQTLNHLSTKDIVQHWQVSGHFEQGLNYHFFDILEDNEILPDITNGRRHINVEEIMPVAKQMMQEIVQYLEGEHIHMNTPNIKQGQLINRLRRTLVLFTLEDLKKLWKSVENSKDLLHVMQQMMPLVGTKASAMMIKFIIEQKLVTDMSVLAMMLQKMPLNIQVPSRQLVTELETWLNWDDSKGVAGIRHVAILSFGTIVHRAYSFEIGKVEQQFVHLPQHMVLHEKNEIQDPVIMEQFEQKRNMLEKIETYYQKYVKMLLNKLEHASNYEEEMVYLSSLYNMRLPSSVKHLLNALKEKQWNNHHHKLAVLWTISANILKDRDLAYKTLWPLLANREEHTEVRLIAYWLLMMTHPDVGRFTNIFWLMQSEHNPEVYHFHYTFVKNVAGSSSPILSKLKTVTSQFLPYMHPPSHGMSTYWMLEFTDPKYIFGGAMEGSVIRSNESLLFVGGLNTQIFNVPSEDAILYIKVHGLKHIEDIFTINTVDKNLLLSSNMLEKIVSGMIKNKDAFVEFYIMDKSYITMSKVFSSNNMPDLLSIWDHLPAMIKKDYIHIDYLRYKKIFLPTELGFPGMYTYCSPTVHKGIVQTLYENKAGAMSLNMDNRYMTWVTARHGIMFYNSIMDVYQGINKYHSNDWVMPMLMSMTLNMPQKNLKISWRRHGDAHKDLWGMRSHATSMVFVKDDLETGVLTKSCAQCENFVLVSNGQEFRHNYTIMDADHSMSGSHWKVVAYDMTNYVSNGTWKQSMQMFQQPHMKHFDTPIGYFLMSYWNWHTYMSIQPPTGTHGLYILLSPLHDHPVSSIDFSFRWNHEINHGRFVYMPGMKLNTRLTYALKDQEKSLKTWDLTTVMDLNPGHTLGNLKMVMTRIIPGQKDYKICVDGAKKWESGKVTGQLSVAMSHAADGKCDKKDTVIDVSMVGQPSEQQLHNNHIYDSCKYMVPYFMQQRYNTMQCMRSYSSLRSYVYNIKMMKLPTEFKKYLSNLWDSIKGSNMDYYSFSDEHNVDVPENHLKVEVMYPMEGKQMDVKIYTPQHKYAVEGIPTKLYQWMGLYPDNSRYSMLFMWAHAIGSIDHCSIHHDTDHHGIKFNDMHMDHQVPNEWTMYVGDTEENPTKAIFLKQMGEHQIAMKLIEPGKVMEIYPQAFGQYKIILDGKTMVLDKEHLGEQWGMFRMLTHDVTQPIVINMPLSGLHLEYNGHNVQIVMPKLDHMWKGMCLMSH